MAQLLFLVVPPGFVWVSSLVAILIGLMLFLITALERSDWNSANKWGSVKAFVSKVRWRKIVKDVGIGFLVAGIVSLTYEWATRSTAERAEGLEIINKVMSGIIGENVWQEVSNETVKVPRVRRNVLIEMRLQRDWALPNGRAVVLPKCRAILYMKFAYDLYRVSSQEPQTPVQQAVNYEMWDDELKLPRFDSVKVSTQINAFSAETVEYKGDRLKEISDKEGSFKLQGKNEVKFPAEAGVPVHIVTERYELVDIPGNYNLTMGALTARVPNTGDHTITLTIIHPDDLETEVTTNWAGHVFTSNADKSVWTFDGIMLPGQGLQVTFKAPHTKSHTLRPCE